MNTSRLWIGTFLLFLVFSLSSKTASAQDKENALLWQVFGNGLEKPSYLFGTIHIINKEDFFWPRGSKQALEASDKVVFEIDMKEMENPAALFSLIGEARMKDGVTLDMLMSKEDYALVKKEIEAMGIPMTFLNSIKPMFLTVFVGEEFSPESLSGGFDGGNIMSYEMEIAKVAEAKNLPTGGLETMAFQMSMFDSIPYKDQAKMLVDAVKDTNDKPEGQDQLSIMVDLYKKQDLKKLNAMMREGDDMMDKYGEILLDGRNIRWVPQMREMMKAGSTFFAVGAGHLPGENGVIELLRKEGYILTPISSRKNGSSRP